jgi:DNA-binding MarR family transcriptional regulator
MGTVESQEAVEATGDVADQLLRLTRRLHRAQRRYLEPLGITPAMSRLLGVAARGEEPPRMVDLAQRLGVVPRAVTTLVDALEVSGLVSRVPDPTNRRVVRVAVTGAGTAALQQLRDARRTAAEELLAPLDARQRGQLGELLSSLDVEPPAHC